MFHSAWDYSAWVRIYALYLEERLECFRVLKYDVETDPPVCNLMQAYFFYLLHLRNVFKSHLHFYICCSFFSPTRRRAAYLCIKKKTFAVVHVATY